MIIDGFFTSVWDNEVEITTKCRINLETKEVFDIETSDVAGIETLTNEYLNDSNGEYLAQVYQKNEALKGEYWYE